jgi:hypothetical protein
VLQLVPSVLLVL